MLETAHFLEVYLPPDLSEHLFYSDSNMQYERMQMLKVLPNRHVTPNTNQQFNNSGRNQQVTCLLHVRAVYYCAQTGKYAIYLTTF